MASVDLTVVRVQGDGSDSPGAPGNAGPLIRRPAELVELAERFYQGVFGVGLLAAAVATLYAGCLGLLQPPGHRAVGVIACALILVNELIAISLRARLYRLLRRRPLLVLVPAVAVGAGAWATGPHNQQLFFVLAILIGVLSPAVPFGAIAIGALVASVGMAAPHISDGSWAIGVALAAGLVPPLFWLIVEQFARFVLRLHQTQEPPQRPTPKRVRVWVERPRSTQQPASTADFGPLTDEDEDGDLPVPLPVDATKLSARQLEVLLLCTEGLRHEEIGDCLQIGPVQVGRHLKNACRKAGVATNAELVAWAITRHLSPSRPATPAPSPESDLYSPSDLMDAPAKSSE